MMMINPICVGVLVVEC